MKKYVPSDLPLCLCGCGQRVVRERNRFIHGHNMRGKRGWMRGLTKETDVRVRKLGEEIGKTMKRQYRDGERISYTKGKDPWNKGLSDDPRSSNYDKRVEKYVKSMTEVVRQQFLNGREPWIKGKTKETHKQLRVQSERIKGDKNPMKRPEVAKKAGESLKGRKTWSKGLTSDPTKPNYDPRIPQSWLGKTFSSTHRQNLAESHIGYEMPEEQKAKIRIARLRQVLPVRDTKIEIAIQDELRRRGITFKKHVVLLGKYQVDLLLKEKLDVECDGIYWHNYPHGTEKDRIRVKELTSAGFVVLRFWGSEIREDVNSCVDKICEEMNV